MTLTHRGEVAVQAAVIAVPLTVLFAAAAAFGYAHPSRTDWALVPLGALLVAACLALALERVVRGVPDQPAGPSRLDLAHRWESEHSRPKYRSHR